MAYIRATFPPGGSVGALPFQHHAHGFDKDVQVDPRVPVAYVVGVELDPEFIGGVRTPGDLPRPRHPRAHLGVVAVVVFVLLDLRFDYGPGADKTHLTFRDVPQLRKLIEARLTQ